MRVLEETADDWLASHLRREAAKLDAYVLGVGNADDHVHVVIRHPPMLSAATLIGRLKGASSYAAHIAGVLRQGDGWQPGYWVESVDPAHCESLLQYVAGQRAHHRACSASEPWQEALK